jgi:hypothetical protein
VDVNLLIYVSPALLLEKDLTSLIKNCGFTCDVIMITAGYLSGLVGNPSVCSPDNFNVSQFSHFGNET